MERLNQNFHFKEDERLLEEMKTVVFSNQTVLKYLRQNKIPDEVIDREIVKIYDFASDLNFCKKCPGITLCNKQTPRLCTRIVYEHGVISRELVPCKKYLEYIKFKAQFKTRDFPEEWLNSELKKIDRTTPRTEAIKKFQSYFKNESSEWLYLIGEAGTGRSFLAANIAIEIAKNEYGPVAFIDTPSRFKELHGTKDPKKFADLIDLYSTVPVLVLDDFGNEFVNDFIRDTIIYPIISIRHNKNLMTIFTSDFTINEIETLYSTSKAGQLRAKQICRIISTSAKKEIDLGTLAIY